MPRRFSIQFAEQLHKQAWWDPHACYVLALSGGMDSMVLAQLMRAQSCRLVLAHVNFKLRGAESDADEAFVKEQAQGWKLPLETCSFDTQSYANEKGISIEMAARELRYQWFRELVQKYQAKGILTAHHANDLAETVLLNMTRGMGIYGLDGIASETKNIFRPLLFATKESIEKYAMEEKLSFRQDSSNALLDIPRNNIRHTVLPGLRQINTRAVEHIGQSAVRVQQMMGLYREYLSVLKAGYQLSQNSIDLERLKLRSDAAFLLFEFIRDTGINGDQITEIVAAREGARFTTETHQLWVTRGMLEIKPKMQQDQHFAEVIFDGPACIHFTQQGLNRQLCVEPYRLYAKDQLAADPMCVYVPKEAIQFPLILRTWKQGDEFIPFGMKHKKKLSDFFVDEKFSPAQKQNQLLLCTQDEIIWVVGSRLSESMRVKNIDLEVYRIMIE